MTAAERAYRAALAAYPAGYRAARGEEMLGTLLETSGDRRLPDLREIASVVTDGYRRRVLASVGPARGAARAGALWGAQALAVLTAAVAIAGVMREDHLAGSLPPALGPHLHVLGLAIGLWFGAFAATAVATLVALAASARRAALAFSLAGVGVQAWEVALAPAGGFPGTDGHFAVYAWTNASSLPREPWHWLLPSLLLPACIALSGPRQAPGARGRAAWVALALALTAGMAVATAHLSGAVAGLGVVLIPVLAAAVAVAPLDPRPALACLPLLATAMPLAWTYVHADPTTPAAGDVAVLAGIPLAILALAASAAASARSLRGPAPPHR